MLALALIESFVNSILQEIAEVTNVSHMYSDNVTSTSSSHMI